MRSCDLCGEPVLGWHDCGRCRLEHVLAVQGEVVDRAYRDGVTLQAAALLILRRASAMWAGAYFGTGRLGGAAAR